MVLSVPNDAVVVFAGPSGAGKTRGRGHLGKLGFKVVTSVTTRQERFHGEKEYKRIERNCFFRMKAEGQFVWTREYHGEMYGTHESHLKRALRHGKRVLEINHDCFAPLYAFAQSINTDVKKILFFYIRSPGKSVLTERLLKRGDSEESVRRRIRECSGYDVQAEKLRLERPDLPIIFLENNSTLDEYFEQIDTHLDRYLNTIV